MSLSQFIKILSQSSIDFHRTGLLIIRGLTLRRTKKQGFLLPFPMSHGIVLSLIYTLFKLYSVYNLTAKDALPWRMTGLTLRNRPAICLD